MVMLNLKISMKKIATFFLFNLSIFIASTQTLNYADSILGDWQIGSGKARIQIKKSGLVYYGQISWLKNPVDDVGKPKVDKNNPNPTKRSIPLIGLRILLGFEYTGNNKWENGTIYDPENGKTYNCIAELINPNSLNVRGYLGSSIVGRTDKWTRISN